MYCFYGIVYLLYGGGLYLGESIMGGFHCIIVSYSTGPGINGSELTQVQEQGRFTLP